MSLINKNICLVGFMASGKTTVAKSLGKLLSRDVLCIDALIEEQEKRSIPEIFKSSGEPYFRSLEKEIVKKVALLDNVIIDCGGGVVLDTENIANLKDKGILIFLEASPEVIYDRIKGQSNRPLLNVDDPQKRIEELLSKRKNCYAKADHTIVTDHKSVDEICKSILGMVSHG